MLTYVKRNLDIFLRRQGRDQIECLEDHANLVIAHYGQFSLAHPCDIDAIDQYLATGGVIQAGDDTQQRTFTRTRWPDNGDEFSTHDLKTDTFENFDLFTS